MNGGTQTQSMPQPVQFPSAHHTGGGGYDTHPLGEGLHGGGGGAPNTSTHNLHRSASRASRRSGVSTTPSRAQSLIKKSIELQDLKPADVLIERFVAWKAIVKQLTAYFEGIADIENNTAKELSKLAGVIQVPFRAGNQFLGEGGLQDVYFSIRDKTRSIADQHANLGRTIESSIVEHLRKLGAEVRAHIKNVQNDTGKLASGVAKERETSTRLVGELANAVSMYKNTPMQIPARSDPYLINQAVSLQLHRQVLEENLLQKSIIIMQQSSAHFESGIVRSIQSAWATYHTFRSSLTQTSSALYEELGRAMEQLEPEREWVSYAGRSEHLLDPETPLRDPELVSWPLKEEPATRALHAGHLERKSATGLFTKGWREGYYVLTPAGFLHEFGNADPSTGKRGTTPLWSIFLPNCTLGPPTGDRNASGGWRFHIEGRRDGTGAPSKHLLGSSGHGTRNGFKALLKGSLKGDVSGNGASGGGYGGGYAGTGGGGGKEGGGGEKAWTFRARSKEEMMEWWNDLRMLCARYLVASESVRRSGPVERAVQSVGYASEDDEDIYYADENDGSSIEEEVDLQVHDNPHAHAHGYQAGAVGYGQHGYEGEVPPSYTGHSRFAGAGGVEVGPNGYLLEKKAPHGAYGYGQSPYYDAHAPEPVGTGTINPQPHSSHPASQDHAQYGGAQTQNPNLTAGNATAGYDAQPVTMQTTGGSTRAQEKAPERVTTDSTQAEGGGAGGGQDDYLPEEPVGGRKQE